MPEGLVPRMAMEWGFLILLAVGAGIADLRPLLIVLVMVIGWILVVLVELLAWRARPRYAVSASVGEPTPPIAADIPVDVAAAEATPSPSYDFEFGRPAALPEPVEEATAVEPAQPAVDDPFGPYAPAPERSRLQEAEERTVYRLEPLKPRPKRRWFKRGS
jgi:hypothetical protein